MRVLLIFFIGLFTAELALAQPQPDGDTKNAKARKCFDEAFSHYNLGDYDKAVAALNKAVKADPNYIDAMELLGSLYFEIGDTANSLKNLRKIVAIAPDFQRTYFYLGEIEYKCGQYENAAAHLKKYLSFNLDKQKLGEKARKYLENSEFAIKALKEVQSVDLKNLGPNINTPMREYWPGLTVDGSTLIFTRLVQGQEDFYYAKVNKNGWDTARAMPGKVNTMDNEGTTAVFADGKRLFFTYCGPEGLGSCDLYVSYSNGILWSGKKNLGPTINSPYWDAQPTISGDGRTLIFVSARPGGLGGNDLWMTKWSNGAWSTPVNLGPTINTPGDEQAPYLHYDGRTLYFASDGHPGFGQHDLFVSRIDELGKFEAPVNIGSPINTENDEVGVYVDRTGALAYFASNRPGGYGLLDLYSFVLPEKHRAQKVSYVKGLVVDELTNKEIIGKIEVLNLNEGSRVLLDSNSQFLVTANPGGNYALRVSAKGYLFYSANFQPTLSSADSPYLVIAKLKAFQPNTNIVLNNIFFETDKYDLKSESFSELDYVVGILISNPNMKIEVEGHTDNTGSAEYNQLLSENRAKSVVNYLISKGINANRLSAKGYGQSRPKATNETVEGKAQNRRIEMKVISI